jgi:hypothetical protein
MYGYSTDSIHKIGNTVVFLAQQMRHLEQAPDDSKYVHDAV